MLKQMLLALIIGAAAMSASAQPAPSGAASTAPPPASRVPSPADESCVSMKPDPVKGYNLTNACSVCRAGFVKWCDGDGRPFDVPAKSTLNIPSCLGFQTLVTEGACQHTK